MKESAPSLGRSTETPLSAFTFAKDTPHGKRPQAIAHRGYSATNPENTMGAFKAAVEVGAHALEIDLHLTQDGVVVVSHDPTLKRCFGQDQKIADCTWDYIQTLRTLQSPHEPMPRFKDVLEYLATPGLDEIWLVLDVKLPAATFLQTLRGDTAVLTKLDTYAENLFKSIATTLTEVQPSLRPWTQRVVVGCWAAKYLPLWTKYLAQYPATHIGFSIGYARQFLEVSTVNISMLFLLMVGPRGNSLLRDARRSKADRAVFLWTVNAESWMKWSIRQEVDGVITDDPKRYLEVCKEYSPEEKLRHSWRTWGAVCLVHVLVLVFSFSFRYTRGLWVDMKKR